LYKKLNMKFRVLVETLTKRNTRASFKSLLINVIVLCGLFFLENNAGAALYYINGLNGSDNNPGSFDSPWKTVEKANSTLQPGDSVFLREGYYKNQPIRPKNSGKSANYITYQNYNDEKVYLSEARIPIYLEEKEYIKIIGFTVTDCDHFFVLYNGSKHNIIKSCTFRNANAYFGSLAAKYHIDPVTAFRDYKVQGSPNDYNKILDNEWIDAPDKCLDAQDQNCGTAPSDMLYIEHGSYNLIQGNIFGSCAHDSLVFGGSATHHNIVRNNIFRNTYRRGLDLYSETKFNLIEKNYFFDHGLKMNENPQRESRNHEPWNPGAIQCIKGSDYMIIRRNVFDNNGNILSFTGQYMHFYHNTANRQIITIFGDGGNYDDKFNIYKNNIFSNTASLKRLNDGQYVYSWNTYVQPGHIMESNIITHNAFTGDNNRWRYNKNYNFSSLAEFEASTKDAFDNNTYIPFFEESSRRNFNLLPKSSLIDAGTWMTVIKSPTNKSQSTFTVDDAAYFFDGWGIENEVGDLIKTANGKFAQIKKIDYESNTINVDPPIDIFQNEGLALYYGGSSPDIGAYEFSSGEKAQISPPSKFRLR
jgi:Right handed beta helix region